MLTYRKLAEQFCLQLDISALNKDNSSKMGRLKDRVTKKIIAPIQNHLRKFHFDRVQNLTSVEVKAMADLAALTEEVLRLHQDDQHTYHKLQTSNECDIASYFVDHVFNKQSISSCPH